jgi:glycerol-3-phosphate cytidylyltransferase
MINGFVCGAFDLIHPGYILLLKDAKSVCQKLTVGLHEDPSLENPDKLEPIHTVEERLLILKAIRYVDDVVVYKTEADLRKLLKGRKYSIRTLGDDYKNKPITEGNKEMVIYWHVRDHDYSYSGLRQKIFEIEFDRMEIG